MDKLTLLQLRCFEAVATAGGFQAGADKLCRSQPTVFAAVKNFESQLGLRLLDRSGYRVALTELDGHFTIERESSCRNSTNSKLMRISSPRGKRPNSWW